MSKIKKCCYTGFEFIMGMLYAGFFHIRSFRLSLLEPLCLFIVATLFTVLGLRTLYLDYRSSQEFKKELEILDQELEKRHSDIVKLIDALEEMKANRLRDKTKGVE